MWLLFISFVLVTAFPLSRVAGAASLGALELLHNQDTSQIFLLAPHQDGTKKVRDVPSGPWATSRLLSRGCSQQGLTRWREYFHISFKSRYYHTTRHLGEVNIITAAEVLLAVKTLKASKAASCDDIRPEMLKALNR